MYQTLSEQWRSNDQDGHIEPQHDKINKVTCAPREDSDQHSDQSSICTLWVAKDPSFFHAVSEDSDQTGWMPMLI